MSFNSKWRKLILMEQGEMIQLLALSLCSAIRTCLDSSKRWKSGQKLKSDPPRLWTSTPGAEAAVHWQWLHGRRRQNFLCFQFGAICLERAAQTHSRPRTTALFSCSMTLNPLANCISSQNNTHGSLGLWLTCVCVCCACECLGSFSHLGEFKK